MKNVDKVKVMCGETLVFGKNYPAKFINGFEVFEVDTKGKKTKTIIYVESKELAEAVKAENLNPDFVDKAPVIIVCIGGSYFEYDSAAMPIKFMAAEDFEEQEVKKLMKEIGPEKTKLLKRNFEKITNIYLKPK